MRVFRPGLPAAGVAEVNAFSWVVTRAIPCGAVPVSFTPRSAIALSRGLPGPGPASQAPDRGPLTRQPDVAGPRVIKISIPLTGPRRGIGLPGVLVAVLTGTTLFMVPA
jgi:hypothetical protein